MDKWITINGKLFNLSSFSCLYVRNIKNPTHEGKQYDIIGMHKYKTGYMVIEEFYDEEDSKEMLRRMERVLI